MLETNQETENPALPLQTRADFPIVTKDLMDHFGKSANWVNTKAAEGGMPHAVLTPLPGQKKIYRYYPKSVLEMSLKEIKGNALLGVHKTPVAHLERPEPKKSEEPKANTALEKFLLAEVKGMRSQINALCRDLGVKVEPVTLQ